MFASSPELLKWITPAAIVAGLAMPIALKSGSKLAWFAVIVCGIVVAVNLWRAFRYWRFVRK